MNGILFRSAAPRNGEICLLSRMETGLVGGKKGKGCGIGYALAANSCEGVGSVGACTVAALDAITAFAVPSPS